MATILDTSVLIRFEKMHATGRTTPLDELDDFFIAAITLSEMLVGVYRSDAQRRPVRQHFVDHMLDRVVVAPFDQSVALTHAGIVALMRPSGLTIGVHDMMIAATAVHHRLQVMTLDQRSFPHIPGVRLAAVPK